MNVKPTLYGYYIIKEPRYIWNETAIAYGTCAFEVMLYELEKGNIIAYIKLRDHD